MNIFLFQFFSSNIHICDKVSAEIIFFVILMKIFFVRYPKIEFFHTDEIRTMMVDALFIYAKLNPDVAYRQVRDQQTQHHNTRAELAFLNRLVLLSHLYLNSASVVHDINVYKF